MLFLAHRHSHASFFSMFFPLLHFCFHPVLCHPTALPKCLHVHALSPDLCMPTGASLLSHHFLHVSALNLSLRPLWFFWKLHHLGCWRWSRLPKQWFICQSIWAEMRCTINPVGEGYNRPPGLLCSAHRGRRAACCHWINANLEEKCAAPATNPPPRALHLPVGGVQAKIPRFLPILVASCHRRAAPVPFPIAPMQPHRQEQRSWNTRGNMPSQWVGKIKRPTLLTDETWVEGQSKLACNSCLFLCKACPRSPATFFYGSFFWELFLCSLAIYYTIKSDGKKMFLVKVGRFYLKYKIMKWQEISRQEKTPAVLHKKRISFFLKKAFSVPSSTGDRFPVSSAHWL